MMRIIVIGLGSMGKRRIRLLKKRQDVELLVGIDSRQERRDETRRLYGIPTVESISEAVENRIFDCAFIWSLRSFKYTHLSILISSSASHSAF